MSGEKGEEREKERAEKLDRDQRRNAGIEERRTYMGKRESSMLPLRL